MDDELEITEVDVPYFEVLSGHSPEGRWGNLIPTPFTNFHTHQVLMRNKEGFS
jgi:hypothetical protein